MCRSIIISNVFCVWHEEGSKFIFLQIASVSAAIYQKDFLFFRLVLESVESRWVSVGLFLDSILFHDLCILMPALITLALE